MLIEREPQVVSPLSLNGVERLRSCEVQNGEGVLFWRCPEEVDAPEPLESANWAGPGPAPTLASSSSAECEEVEAVAMPDEGGLARPDTALVWNLVSKSTMSSRIVWMEKAHRRHPQHPTVGVS